jgi:hypothetical protein
MRGVTGGHGFETADNVPRAIIDRVALRPAMRASRSGSRQGFKL